jgi:hypothetical protein
MDTYVIRIYRNEHQMSRQVVGIVQDVATDRQHSFMDIDELWKILKHEILRAGLTHRHTGHPPET